MDLASHRGIVHLPYQVSTMSIFEQYRMNIPLFFPTKRLLIEWNTKYWALRERTWQYWETFVPVNLPPHRSQKHVPNPNDNRNITAVRYWIEFADYYVWPHITYFDSFSELVNMLNTLTVNDLLAISERMKLHNADVRRGVSRQWTNILKNVAKYSKNHDRTPYVEHSGPQ